MSARRFPPPWSVEELDACFVVRDASGRARARLRLFRGMLIATRLSSDGRVGADRRFAASGMTSANYSIPFGNTTQAPPAVISLRQSFSR
jgi:hypothetical protein